MQSINNYRSGVILIVTAIILSLGMGCKSTNKESSVFIGDEKAVVLADKMFQAIGGTEGWCNLKSLYIKAEHTEPQMTIPYTSEIWRGIDRFEMVIEQKNDSFHVKGVVDKQGGQIRYYDKRDTFRTLSAEQLAAWEFDHNHNIYVILHEIGCSPESYLVEFDEEKRLSFYRDSAFVASFKLDDQMRPHLFYRPNMDGSVSGSIFTHWGTDNGLTHSEGGHPLDSNFIYRSEIWQPSEKTLKETFGERIFSLE